MSRLTLAVLLVACVVAAVSAGGPEELQRPPHGLQLKGQQLVAAGKDIWQHKIVPAAQSMAAKLNPKPWIQKAKVNVGLFEEKLGKTLIHKGMKLAHPEYVG